MNKLQVRFFSIYTVQTLVGVFFFFFDALLVSFVLNFFQMHIS